MVEPISTIAAVGAVYSGLKSALAVGKEISSLGKQIGTVFDAIEGAQNAHRQKAARKGTLSANQEALDTFLEKQRADDMEKELREMIIATRGYSAWSELVKIRADVRRQRKEEERAAKKARAEKIEAILTYGAVAFFVISVLTVAIMLMAKFSPKF